MENLALEVFDIATKETPKPTTSQFAVLEDDATITVTDTSEVFASGDVWSHSFKLNIPANSHIFGTAGDMHGSRLHDQINKRRARLWVMGLPLYLGYLKLDDEADVDKDGNVDVSFESGQKTFGEMIDGINAREVSVGNVAIGIALNRRRVIESVQENLYYTFTLDGLSPYATIHKIPNNVIEKGFRVEIPGYSRTVYSQRWPKFVKSVGKVKNAQGEEEDIDYTNVQTPYDGTPAHSFCNINICYQMKVNDNGEEKAARGYTLRLAHSDEDTTDGGDGQTRYNNAPNFYLLYFIDRLFKDLGISIQKNEAFDVEDIRRVFLLNYGCFYEEIEDTYDNAEDMTNPQHKTPDDKIQRYGQYYMPVTGGANGWKRGLLDLESARYTHDGGIGIDGKILLRDVRVTADGYDDLSVGSIEGKVHDLYYIFGGRPERYALVNRLVMDQAENNGYYSSYIAYATGDNYPNVEISNIIDAMKSMFGIRLLFNGDYSTVRIILLRNVFRNNEVQEIQCDIVDDDVKVENSKRGFRMTYGKGKDDTSFYYKGFADLFTRKATTWKDTTDKHDYSQWDLNAVYDEIKQYVSAFNKICYVTPVTGNAFGIKVDEDEDVLFPSLFEYAGFMDAEDGDCSALEEDGETVEEVQVGATPVIMNNVGSTYASLFSGDLKAPSIILYNDNGTNSGYSSKIATYAKVTKESAAFSDSGEGFSVSGKLDIYMSEGFRVNMQDNYAISNGGTPFDEADPGLRFGVMRSSGSDATVRYTDDPDDDENDTWDVLPGSNAVSHHDTCDEYGNEWDYKDSVKFTPADAAPMYAEMFPNGNASFADVKANGVDIFYIRNSVGVIHAALMMTPYPPIAWHAARFRAYIDYLDGHSDEEIMQLDAAGYMDYQNCIVELDSSYERCDTCRELIRLALGYTDTITIDESGVASKFGRFSLKLRAEKLNPYYTASLPDIVRTKGEAAMAMTKLYTTSDTNLLTRTRVDYATLRSHGWDIQGDGDARSCVIALGAVLADGNIHYMAFTPIAEEGRVLSPQELSMYLSNRITGHSVEELKAQDIFHLILDVNTTAERTEVLHQLLALYYEDEGDVVTGVDITSVNSRYLEITNPNLRGRGLADTFYKEYSYWMRNARIIKRTVRMELAQLLSLDKTKKVKVGDITGFIRKMQYSVSNKTGLGDVTMEIMYI